MSRKIKFETNNYYHIYNRGVDKRLIFNDKFDYRRFIESLSYFNRIKPIQSIYFEKKREKTREKVAAKLLYSSLAATKEPLVQIIVYNLLPNHFHIIIKQLVDNGISMFMQKLCSGYSHYFNSKYERSGILFQGPYKAIHINDESYMLWLIGYILGNSEIHDIKKYLDWPWSNIVNYIKSENYREYYEQPQDFNKHIKFIISESKIRKSHIKYNLEN